jgi:hypothetical protein
MVDHISFVPSITSIMSGMFAARQPAMFWFHTYAEPELSIVAELYPS